MSDLNLVTLAPKDETKSCFPIPSFHTIYNALILSSLFFLYSNLPLTSTFHFRFSLFSSQFTVSKRTMFPQFIKKEKIKAIKESLAQGKGDEIEITRF